MTENDLLTVKEAAGYLNLGEKKLRQLMDEHDDLVLMCGSRKLKKRTKMERFLENTSCIQAIDNICSKRAESWMS